MITDVHSHFLAPEALEYIKSHYDVFKTDFITLGNKQFMRFADGGLHPLSVAFTSIEQCLSDMAERHVDKTVYSTSPAMFYYDMEPRYANDIAVICNDYAAEMAARYPDKIEAMATIPMQDMEFALAELERARTLYGIRAVEIACIIPGTMPDSEYLYPFYEYCEKNKILIFMHPTFTGHEPPYDRYYNMNLIGYVQETNWALNRMIFGGVFEKYPDLHVLTCHGGGLFPYQFGRLIHGWQVRSEAKVSCPRSPESYLKNIFFDTITHWNDSLQFLVDSFGSSQVILGTDYPYDMADAAPAETLRALQLDSAGKDMIAYANYESLFK